MGRPKPKHLSREYASQFADGSVVAAYGCRPVHPDAVSALLAALVPEGAPRVLEIGSGTGDLALQLLPFASEIDAVEPP